MSLKRTFGLSAAVSIVIGSIIGSGIFMKPATMAAQLGSPELLILAWVVAGVITLFGALSTAELASMMPETGANYIFFQKIYGNFVAFLYGWAGVAVFNTAAIASIAYVCGTYIEYFIHLPQFDEVTEQLINIYLPFLGNIFPLQNIGVKIVTLSIVILFTFINYRSTKVGGSFLMWVTSLKLIAIIIVIAGILFSGAGNTNNFFTDSSSNMLMGWPLMAAFVAALSGAFWGYDGWNNISCVAGEIKQPQKNIPRSLFMGVLACIIVYVLVNVAYLYVLPIDVMATSTIVATDAVKMVIGGIGAGLVAIMIILSTSGTTHGNILAPARVTFAMAEQGYFFKSIGKVHPKFGTPANALLLQGVISCIYVISGTFDMLTDMLIFVSYLFYGMSALGVFILRKRLPDANRPYRVWGYPIVPFVFVAFTVFFLFMTLINDVNNYTSGKAPVINSLLGLVILSLGIPLYLYFNHRLKKIRPAEIERIDP